MQYSRADAPAAAYIVYGSDYTRMTKQLLHDVEMQPLPNRAAHIALKPNLVVSRPAPGGATTHPEVVAGVIEFLQDCGCTNITIMEGSWVGDDTRRAFSACGYEALAKRYGVKLHDLKKDAATPVDTPAGPIKVCKSILAADYLINLPVLKGHCQTRMTCAIKNLKGCIPDSEKRRFHSEGLDHLIAGLPFAVKPDLTLVDGICGDLDFEEGGNPVRADRLVLGTDLFGIDLLACHFMGMDPADVGYLAQAGEWGLGDIGADPKSFIMTLNEPTTSQQIASGGKVAKLAKFVDEDKACSACYANLIHALQRLSEKRLQKSPPRICIGQGWKEKEIPTIGIGECCRKANIHIPGCPPSAADIYAFLERA
jgi:Uncharacterized conserved protein